MHHTRIHVGHTGSEQGFAGLNRVLQSLFQYLAEALAELKNVSMERLTLKFSHSFSQVAEALQDPVQNAEINCKLVRGLPQSQDLEVLAADAHLALALVCFSTALLRNTPKPMQDVRLPLWSWVKQRAVWLRPDCESTSEWNKAGLLLPASGNHSWAPLSIDQHMQGPISAVRIRVQTQFALQMTRSARVRGGPAATDASFKCS